MTRNAVRQPSFIHVTTMISSLSSTTSRRRLSIAATRIAASALLLGLSIRPALGQVARTFPLTGSGPRALTRVDADGSSPLDLLVVNSQSNDVTVLVADSRGASPAASTRTIPLGTGNIGPMAVDVLGPDRTSVAICCNDSNTVVCMVDLDKATPRIGTT